MIGFIIALEQEYSIPNFNNFQKQTIFGYQFFVSEEKNFVLAYCQVGKINAAICTCLLLTKFDIDLVINIGTCGGVSKYEIADVLIITKIFDHDVDLTFFGYQIGQLPKENTFFKTNKIYMEKICELLDNLKFSYYKNVFCSSGDKFICQSNFENLALFNTFKINCVDMELFAIAMCCKKNNIPFIAIKIVSDLIFNAASENDFYNNMKLINNKINLIFDTIIKKL